MPFIAILGCDGSGKSSVIEKLSYQLLEQEHRVQFGHWRPRIFGKYSAITSKRTACNPHGSSVRSPFSSFLKLCWMGFNWWFEWLRVLGQFSRKGYLIFDRFHADLIIDPNRYRFGGKISLAESFSRMMPQPDLVIYLDAPTEILLSRKSEVSADALNKSREGYFKLCANHKNYHVLDATAPLDTVVDNVSNLLSSYVSHQ